MGVVLMVDGGVVCKATFSPEVQMDAELPEVEPRPSPKQAGQAQAGPTQEKPEGPKGPNKGAQAAMQAEPRRPQDRTESKEVPRRPAAQKGYAAGLQEPGRESEVLEPALAAEKKPHSIGSRREEVRPEPVPTSRLEQTAAIPEQVNAHSERPQHESRGEEGEMKSTKPEQATAAAVGVHGQTPMKTVAASPSRQQPAALPMQQNSSGPKTSSSSGRPSSGRSKVKEHPLMEEDQPRGAEAVVEAGGDPDPPRLRHPRAAREGQVEVAQAPAPPPRPPAAW